MYLLTMGAEEKMGNGIIIIDFDREGMMSTIKVKRWRRILSSHLINV
jgi:hypothetical protein